jgi:hypothetical protein
VKVPAYDVRIEDGFVLVGPRVLGSSP